MAAARVRPLRGHEHALRAPAGPGAYGLRLVAFLLIVLAILLENRE